MGNKNTIMKLPADLQNELDEQVKDGEFKSERDIVEAALRYYFERHSSKGMASYVDEEINTALEGSA